MGEYPSLKLDGSTTDLTLTKTSTPLQCENVGLTYSKGTQPKLTSAPTSQVSRRDPDVISHNRTWKFAVQSDMCHIQNLKAVFGYWVYRGICKEKEFLFISKEENEREPLTVFFPFTNPSSNPILQHSLKEKREARSNLSNQLNDYSLLNHHFQRQGTHQGNLKPQQRLCRKQTCQTRKVKTEINLPR